MFLLFLAFYVFTDGSICLSLRGLPLFSVNTLQKFTFFKSEYKHKPDDN